MSLVYLATPYSHGDPAVMQERFEVINRVAADLMRWLVRLVTPPGGILLDPFAGSGTTGVAAILEGRRCILIEREEQYCDIAAKRISQAKAS